MYCYALCTQSGCDIGSMYIDIDKVIIHSQSEKSDITDTITQSGLGFW